MNDLISRQEAIEAIDSVDYYHQDRNGEMVHGANPAEHQAWYKEQDVYEALNGVQSEQQWIPCSERLPEDVQIGDEYPIVIFCTKEKTYAGFYEYYLGGRWWEECGDYVVNDVIAWMPLPEPYREG